MRNLILLVLGAIFLASTISAQAATSTTAPSNHSFKNPHPVTHQINMRMRTQWLLIQKGYKAGKFTKDQVATFKASLRATRQLEVNFFKQNGNHELTADQKSQLDNKLDQNSSILGENTSTTN